jgi:hypothetical protein
VNLNSIRVYQYQIMRYNYRCLGKVKAILKNKIDYLDINLLIAEFLDYWNLSPIPNPAPQLVFVEGRS